MERAVMLSTNAVGSVWPNPAVGCVIVADDKIISEGVTQPGGRPHAEFIALSRLETDAKGATAYVTLEPCAHEGETPSCARLLIEAGVKSVYVAVSDPDPRTRGLGCAMMRKAGIDVQEGLCARQATSVLEGYLKKKSTQKPFVTLKLATSFDGKIARSDGTSGPQRDSLWITSPEARNHAQLLRANHDAILVGVDTANIDDPKLTCRLEGYEHRSPVRIILDSKGRIKRDLHVIKTAGEIPTWLVGCALSHCRKELPNIKCIEVENTRSIDTVLRALADAGITKLLVEGGAAVASSFLESGNVDRFEWYKSKDSIGREGLSVIQNLDEKLLLETFGMARVGLESVGPDTLETFERER